MNLPTTRKKLNAWIDLLTAADIARGRTWYADARIFAEECGRLYSVPLERVVGVLAVLSVQNRWDVNKRDCEAMCRAHKDGLPWPAVATYSVQKNKAIDILTCEPGTDIKPMIGTKYAPKTSAFYDNILHPGTSFRVTIDRWILRGLDLEKSGSGRGGNSYVATYRTVEELFRQAAARVDVVPCELQAAVWCRIQETAAAEEWEGSRPGTGLAEEAAPF